MPSGLKRFQREGDDHFITFSCYRREPYLATSDSKDIFLDSLELTRRRYNFEVLGYVVMPEHVHLDGWPTSDSTTTSGCPIFATVLSSLRWVIFAAAKIPIL